MTRINFTKLPKIFLAVAAIAGALAVILGAFGAHALAERLAEAGKTAVWKTAVDYLVWHALALLGLTAAIAAGLLERVKLAAISGGLWIVGSLLFSGSLFWLALDGPRWLGPITPLGGLCLVAGWLVLGGCALQARREPL